MDEIRVIEVKQSVFADNDADAARLRAQLKTHTNPSRPRAVVPIPLTFYRIAERKEAGFCPAFFSQSINELRILIIHHLLQALLRHITAHGAVECIAHGHIISRDGFGNRAGSTGGAEEPVSGFLAGADFCKRAIHSLIHINTESFLLSSS